MSRGLTVLAMAAASVCSSLAFHPAVAGADGTFCATWRVEASTGVARCVAWVLIPADPGREYQAPDDDGREPGDRGSGGQVSDGQGSDDRGSFDRGSGGPDLDRDSVGLAPGGGTGVPPPLCTETVLRARSRTRTAADDRGLDTGYAFVETFYERVCDDGTRTVVRRDTDGPVLVVPGGRVVAPPPDPADLARELYGEMILRLPTPTVRVAPAETDSDGWVYVQTPAFFWVDEWDGMFQTLTVGSVSVTLTMTPARLDVDPGDGGFVSCAAAPPFPAGADPMSFKGCGYVYKHSSAMADNGESYPVEATMVWTANWTSNVGVGGSLGELTTVGTRDLQVAEVQAILVEG